MYYSVLKITGEALEQCFTQIENQGGNDMYMTPILSGVIFMKYYAEQEERFVLIDEEQRALVSGKKWGWKGNYVGRREKDNDVYLHRVIAEAQGSEQIVHHTGCRFDNRQNKLELTTRKEHDQHRTYSGTLYITVDVMQECGAL